MASRHWLCELHDDCFALDRFGRCRALQDTTFKGDCPFYKTVEQQQKEAGYVHCEERRVRYEY